MRSGNSLAASRLDYFLRTDKVFQLTEVSDPICWVN